MGAFNTSAWSWDEDAKRLLGWLVFYKLMFLLVALGSASSANRYQVVLHEGFYAFHLSQSVALPWPRGESPCFASRFATWDAGNYLAIAANGYGEDVSLNAYYPLWPMMIAPVMLTFGPKAGFFWALLLANGLSIVAIMLLYSHYVRQGGRKVARLAVVLMLGSPGAIFLSLIYTESLFLLLSVAALVGMARRSYSLFSASAFLLPLTKAVGILILIPAIYHLLRCRVWSRWWIAISPLAGYMCYFGIMAWSTGDPFAGFHAQRFYLNHPSMGKITDIRSFLTAMGDVGPFIHPTKGVLDRLCFVAFVVGALYCRHFNKEDFVYALMIGMIPALSNQFVSYTRFIVVCFPIFLGLSSGLLHQIRNSVVVVGLVGASSAVQIYCLWRYVNFEYVG